MALITAVAAFFFFRNSLPCSPFLFVLLKRFLGVKAVSLQAVFDPPGGDKAVEFAMATEGALMLLIWGEVRAGVLEERGDLLQRRFWTRGCWVWLLVGFGGADGVDRGNRVFGGSR